MLWVLLAAGVFEKLLRTISLPLAAVSGRVLLMRMDGNSATVASCEKMKKLSAVSACACLLALNASAALPVTVTGLVTDVETAWGEVVTTGVIIMGGLLAVAVIKKIRRFM